VSYETILYAEDGPIGTITLDRPNDGNMFTPLMCHEVRDCINAIRRETRTRVVVLTGAGDKFFCIGGRKEGMEKTTLYAGTNGGGTFRTVDAAASWIAINTGLVASQILALAADPATATTLYAGTNGGGAFKSTTGGTSWSPRRCTTCWGSRWRRRGG